MEIKNLLNVKNTEIYKNGVILGGVVYFSMKSAVSTKVEYEYGGKGLYEILSAQPWEIVSSSESYVITLKRYTQDFADFGNDSFKLEFRSGDKSRIFEGCKTTSVESYVDDNGKLITVSTINAERVA